MSIPLVYFASLYFIVYLEHLDLLGQLGVEYDPIYGYVYNLFLNTVRTGGGIMFGIGFFVHAQLKNSLNLRNLSILPKAKLNVQIHVQNELDIGR